MMFEIFATLMGTSACPDQVSQYSMQQRAMSSKRRDKLVPMLRTS